MTQSATVFYTLFLMAVFIMPSRAMAQTCGDEDATPETKALYVNLSKLSDSLVLFGHQDDMAYGVGWKYEEGRSDVQSVTGEYPAVFGWDLGHLELGHEKNLDGVPFSKMQDYIRHGYEMGCAVTISWHLRNPMTGGSSWDTAHHTVQSILPGGDRHKVYLDWLEKLAGFLRELKDTNGVSIPILFRPFHELTGHWFWWGEASCTPDEFKELWRFTVHHLRKDQALRNLIMVYNTAEIRSDAHFYERYPGDDVVDVISVDTYQHGPAEPSAAFIQKTRGFLEILTPIAKNRNKLLAFAETGYEGIPDSLWWTQTLLPAIAGFPVAWVLVWRNEGFMPSTNTMHHYAPYPGHKSAEDFSRFSRNPRIVFQKEVRNLNIYNHPQPL